MVVTKVALAAAILTYLARTERMGFSRLGMVLQRPMQVALLLALMLLLVFVLAARWRLLLGSQGYICPFRAALALTFIAIFFDSLLPGGTSDIVRGYYFDKTFQPHDRVRAASTVAVDRFLGVMGLLLLALAALILQSRPQYQGQLPALRVLVSVTGVIFLGGFLFLCGGGTTGRRCLERLASRTRTGSVLLTIYEALRGYRQNQSTLLKAVGLAMVGHGIVIACFCLLGSFMGETNLLITDYLFLVPVGLCIAQLPIAPGGIGVGHAGFYSLFAMAGSHLGADIFSLYIVIHFLASLPGLAYFFSVRHKPDPVPVG